MATTDSKSVHFLPTHDESIMAKSIGDELGDDYRRTYGSQPVWVELMAASCLAMTIGLYLFCSFVYPDHLVCSYLLDRSISSALVVTTALLRTLEMS
jgi:hypothetical protein